MKNKVEGFGWVAVIKFKKVREWLAQLEGNDGKQGIARERQIERGLWPSMTMMVFLPSRGVAFVVVAIFNTPVLASSPV